MKIAVFSDVHGNLEALQAFLQSVAQYQVDRFMFLGDIVGYGPNPNECIDLVRRLPQIQIVLGNHDAAVTWRTSPYSMNSHAREAVFWTMKELTQANLDFLNGLDSLAILDGMTFSHATPHNPVSWRYLNNNASAFLAFLFSKSRYNFVSHTHRPQLISAKKLWKIGITDVQGGGHFSLDTDKRWIVNCGSVGQPRNNTPDGCYCIFDTQHLTATFHAISYDIDQTIAKIRAAGLPDYLAKRLKHGV